MPTSDNGLTGVWQGLYGYADGLTVSFTAVLIETASHLSGSTHEPCATPGCPLATHEAFLSGSRRGMTVSFKKAYAPMIDGFQTADYEGALNVDQSEIEGRWTISEGAGKFLMIRSPGAEQKVSETKLEKV